jgi:CheY-like chemotaxis protein
VGEGTGLGLSLALGIAEAHGGTLALVPVESGACFRLTLPVAAASTATAGDASPGAPAVPAVSGRRALVVDDEPALRRMLHRMLVRRGFSVDLAEDGDRASHLLEHHQYDVIFSDFQMPNMDGLALYEWIRRRRPTSATTFVFVMGGLMTPELQSTIDAARIPVLSKPFGSASFDALLGELFSAA